MLYEVITNIDLPGQFCLVKKSDLGVAFGDSTLRRLIDLVNVDMVADIGVITSYSIHYTKLYELQRRLRR